MTVYDVAMIGAVIAGMAWGAVRGFAWGIASIGATLVGFFGAHHISAYLLPFLASTMPGDPAIQKGAAMLLSYLALAGTILGGTWSSRATLRKMKFELHDRKLGVALGGAEGVLLGVIATFFVASLSPPTRAPIFSSRSGRVVASIMDAAGPAIPPEVHSAIAPYWGGSRPELNSGLSIAADPAPIPADDLAPSRLALEDVADRHGFRLSRETAEAPLSNPSAAVPAPRDSRTR